MTKLAACLLNISEARNAQLVEKIARAACIKPTTNKTESVVLNIFSDLVYNRSVISIAGTLEGLKNSVVAASSQALSSIDISSHEGNHPRKGSVDLIPIHPITENTNLEDCGKIAVEIGSELKLRHPDLSVFYFGHADLPEKRDLVQRRKEVGWFEKDEKNPKSKSGLTGIGAIPYMSNFNVMINCSDIKIGHKIAKSIRERNGGLLGVQSMAFVHGQDQIEIACNVDLIHNPKDKTDLSQIFGSYYMTPFQTIYDEIQKLTEENNCSMKGDSVIIGFTPKELGRITQECLNSGETWAVGKFKRSM